MPVPPFNQYLGVEVDRMEKGEAQASLVVGPHHLNGRGVAHGGVISALLDTVLGAAVIASIPKEWWCATISLSVQFLEGAREGRIVASGKVVRRGKRVAFADGEVRDGSGRLLATASGSWHLWPFRPGVAAPAETTPFVVMRGTGERIPVGKILCVGRNYADHVKEMGNAAGVPPVLFLKPPSAIVHDGGVVRLPEGTADVHHEVEMVVVIGKSGRAIAEAAAFEHVLGYAVGLDLTARDVQAEAKKKGEPWTLAKGFDGAAPVSTVAPRAEVGDGSGLRLSVEVSGATRQDDTTSKMIHGVASLVALASRWITLERGDLLFTGTPSGVGPVRPGDVATARLEKVGELRVRVEGPTS
jgi:5-carboxymethyl-2-hydroxymuconate isomerase